MKFSEKDGVGEVCKHRPTPPYRTIYQIVTWFIGYVNGCLQLWSAPGGRFTEDGGWVLANMKHQVLCVVGFDPPLLRQRFANKVRPL